MRQDEFRRAVKILFGGAGKMSSATGINLRSIRRWSSGEAVVPDGVRAMLRHGLFEVMAEIQSALDATDPASGYEFETAEIISTDEPDFDAASYEALSKAAFDRIGVQVAGAERRYDPQRRAWIWHAWGLPLRSPLPAPVERD